MAPEFIATVFAAGRGERLGELGCAMPKCLLPVWDEAQPRPLLGRLLDQLEQAGPGRIVIVVNHLAEAVNCYLRSVSRDLGVPVSVVRQSELNGEAGGLFLEEDMALHHVLAVDGDNYIGDNLFLARLVDEHMNGNFAATIGVVEVKDVCRYANAVVSSEGLLLSVVEKPDPGRAVGQLAKMGCYVLGPDLLRLGPDYFRSAQGLVETTAAFDRAVKDGMVIRCVRHEGYYSDLGAPDSYAAHLRERH